LVSTLPVFVLLGGYFSAFILSLIIMCLVIAKHQDNIVRLARGEEMPWQSKTYTEIRTASES
jgi:glycerol-3-phosphate acyltransferase PlsY